MWLRAGGDVLGDVGEHRVLVEIAGCGRRRPPGTGQCRHRCAHRATPATAADQPLLAADGEAGVPVERREEVLSALRASGRDPTTTGVGEVACTASA